MAGWKMDLLKMYSLLKMRGFSSQPCWFTEGYFFSVSHKFCILVSMDPSISWGLILWRYKFERCPISKYLKHATVSMTLTFKGTFVVLFLKIVSYILFIKIRQNQDRFYQMIGRLPGKVGFLLTRFWPFEFSNCKKRRDCTFPLVVLNRQKVVETQKSEKQLASIGHWFRDLFPIVHSLTHPHLPTVHPSRWRSCFLRLERCEEIPCSAALRRFSALCTEPWHGGKGGMSEKGRDGWEGSCGGASISHTHTYIYTYICMYTCIYIYTNVTCSSFSCESFFYDGKSVVVGWFSEPCQGGGISTILLHWRAKALMPLVIEKVFPTGQRCSFFERKHLFQHKKLHSKQWKAWNLWKMY